MNRFALPLLSFGLVLIAGCANQPVAADQTAAGAQVAVANPNERKQVCVREQPAGSLTMQTKCHYEDDDVRKAMNLDAFRNEVNRSTRPTVPMGTGG